MDRKRVEVLADIDWLYIATVVLASHHRVDVRCRLVLQACPYLQHLDIIVDAYAHVMPSHDDTIALLCRLRSLYLTQYQNDDAREQATETLCVDFEQMLSSLPHLTILECDDLRHLGVSELLEITSHSTLKTVRIRAYRQQLADEEWIGRQIEFPISVEEDEIQLEQDATRMVFDGDIEEGSDQTALVARDSSTSREQLADGVDDETEPAWVRDETKRLLAALTRTQPTQRSCEVRLALADWLWRRLRRGRLHTDQQAQPVWLLRSRRKQVALLRSTLRRQLSELTEAASSQSEAVRLRIQQLDTQLRMQRNENEYRVTGMLVIYMRGCLQGHRQQADGRRADAEVPDMFQRSDHAIKESAMTKQLEEEQQKAAVLQLNIQRLEALRAALLASGSAVQESPGAQLALVSEEDADYMTQASGGATSAEQPSPTRQSR